MSKGLPNSSGLAFLDVLSNGVAAIVLLITIFGASLVVRSRSLSQDDGLTLQITSDPDIALAAAIRTKEGTFPLALTEVGEDGNLSDQMVDVGSVAAVTSQRRESDRVVILSVVPKSTPYLCFAVYTPVWPRSGDAPNITVNAGSGAQMSGKADLLLPSTWRSVRRAGAALTLGTCDENFG